MTVSNNQITSATRDGVLITRLTLNASGPASCSKAASQAPSCFRPEGLLRPLQRQILFFTWPTRPRRLVGAVRRHEHQTTRRERGRATCRRRPDRHGGLREMGRHPTIGFNKDYIVANYNVFNYQRRGDPPATSARTYYSLTRRRLMQTLSTVSLFQDTGANCVSRSTTFLGAASRWPRPSSRTRDRSRHLV